MNQKARSESIALSEPALKLLADRVPVPTYKREGLGRGIVHIGAGGFNRSHLAVYLDDLLQSGGNRNWGECGVGLLPPDERLHDALTAQDYLYGVLECGDSGARFRVVGSLIEHLYAPTQTDLVLERMSSPECSIVSLTVTEGGYFIEDGSKRFLDSDHNILHDLAFPWQPATFLGFLAEAADRRRRRDIAPFTVLSCDNLQGNGDTARAALLAFAELRDPGLRRWIDSKVLFPNSMVDRITPSTTDENRDFISREFLIRDKCPVVAEPFRQWVMEDRFCTGRPAWERVGATFTTDVAAFERVKMRLLNGGHSAIAYLAALLGFNYVNEAVADPQIRGVLVQFLDETAQVLSNLPGLELNAYKQTVLERFANPHIRDQIGRIASEGTAKMAKFIVPTINEIISARGNLRLLPLVVAAWLHAMAGKDESGRPILIKDSSSESFVRILASNDYDVCTVLSSIPGFEALAAHDHGVVTAIQTYLHRFRGSGVRATLDEILSTGSVSANRGAPNATSRWQQTKTP